MKILFITTSIQEATGYGRYVRDISSSLKKKGHSICYVVRDDQIAEAGTYPVLKEVHKYWFNVAEILRSAYRVNKIIRNFQPVIVHFTAESYASITPFLFKRGARVFMTAHGTFSYIPLQIHNPFLHFLSTCITFFAYRGVDQVVAVSRFTRGHLLKYISWLSKKITVITNGISITPKNCVEEIVTKKSKKLLFVGSVKERKGVLEALQGFKYYLEIFAPEVDVHFDIVGSFNNLDSYYLRIRSWLKENNMEDKITLHGHCSDKDLQDFYCKSDLFVMTSKYYKGMFEGFGLVYLEANGYGVPCIGSIESGAIDAIQEGETGYLVDPSDPNAIAEKIHLVLDNGSIDRKACLDWAMQNDVSYKVDHLFKLYTLSINSKKKSLIKRIVRDVCTRNVSFSKIRTNDLLYYKKEGYGGKQIEYWPVYSFFTMVKDGHKEKARELFFDWYEDQLTKYKNISKEKGGMYKGSLYRLIEKESGKPFGDVDELQKRDIILKRVDQRISLFDGILEYGYKTALSETISVVKKDGFYYLKGGHHRVAILKILGKSFVPRVLVFPNEFIYSLYTKVHKIFQ